MASARILIADDHEAARAAIRSELHRHHDLTVCGEASNGEEAIQQARSLNTDDMRGIVLCALKEPVDPDVRFKLFDQLTGEVKNYKAGEIQKVV